MPVGTLWTPGGVLPNLGVEKSCVGTDIHPLHAFAFLHYRGLSQGMCLLWLTSILCPAALPLSFFYILSSPKRAKHCLLLAFHAQFLGLTPPLAAILLPAAGVSSALVLSPPKPEDPAAAPMFLQQQKDSFGVCYPSLWQEKILGQGFQLLCSSLC